MPHIQLLAHHNTFCCKQQFQVRCKQSAVKYGMTAVKVFAQPIVMKRNYRKKTRNNRILEMTWKPVPVWNDSIPRDHNICR